MYVSIISQYIKIVSVYYIYMNFLLISIFESYEYTS